MQYNSCFYSSYILQPRAELCPLLKPSGTALSPHLPTPLHSTLSQRHAQKNLVRTFSHLSQSFCNSTWRNVPPQRYPRNTQCILSLIQTMQSVLLSSDHKHLLMSQCLETCKHTHCIFFFVLTSEELQESNHQNHAVSSQKMMLLVVYTAQTNMMAKHAKGRWGVRGWLRGHVGGAEQKNHQNRNCGF